MSDEEKVSSLFDLDYHEEAELPNGSTASVFVPEYIPTPPQQKDDSDLLDAEICDFLNKIMTDALLIESGDSITANKLVRAILKRQKGE